MRVVGSRFTPGIKAHETSLRVGEKVKYKNKKGDIVDIVIDSEIMNHDEVPFVYECIMPDGTRGAADTDRILWWEGKCETSEDLDRMMGKG